MSKDEDIINQEMLMLRNDQEAGYVVPKLMHELEVEIFARLPCFEYWKLQVLNKRFAQLLKSGEFFRLKRERELMKPKTCWRMFDMDFEHFQKLPEVHSDFCFFYGDKESISAGTQLIVIGREKEGIVVWRYELENIKRFKGPAMNTLRVMYGSASRGTDAFFAGGVNENYQVVNIAEKYNANTKTWTVIHEMHKRRKYSSGCFLGDKFYVIGGRNENDEYLTCGEGMMR